MPINNGLLDLGNQMEFPLIYLRDNCQCQDCFHKDTRERLVSAVEMGNDELEVEEAVLNGKDEVYVNQRSIHVRDTG